MEVVVRLVHLVLLERLVHRVVVVHLELVDLQEVQDLEEQVVHRVQQELQELVVHRAFRVVQVHQEQVVVQEFQVVVHHYLSMMRVF